MGQPQWDQRGSTMRDSWRQPWPHLVIIWVVGGEDTAGDGEGVGKTEKNSVFWLDTLGGW